MRSPSLLFALMAMAIGAMPANAADVPAPPLAPAQSGTHLFVELVINGEVKDAIVDIIQDGDHLWIDATELRSAGIDVRTQGRIDVGAYPGFAATYDQERQRLLLDVPVALLPTSKIAGDATARAPTSVSTGAVLNYDLFAQRSGGNTAVSLWSEQRVFGHFGTISNTGIVRSGSGGRDGYIRYDTSYRLIDEDRALAFTAGDTITTALPWSTAVRIGGLQLSRSFRTRPDLVTVPLPDFAGQAAVPSGVDLFIDGYRQQHADVAPGRFVLDNIPVVNGAGEARVVTTDAVGRQVATVIPFYVAPELLRHGLTDFSVEIGALRKGYGISNFGYGRPVMSGSLRHGLTSHFTIEAHGELSSGLQLGGVGAAWAPGLWGAIHGSAVVSRRDGMTGGQFTVGYTYTSRRFSLGAEHVERTGNFGDLGSFDLRDWRGGSRSDRASTSFVIDGFGSIGAGYIDARARDGSRARLASASFSMPVNRRISAFGAIDYDVDRKAFSAQLRIVIPLGGNNSASAGISNQPGRGTLFDADYSRSVPTDGGFGVAASAATGTRGDFYGQASATWRGDSFQVDAGASTAPGSTSVYGGVTGAVAVLGGKAYVANQLPDAFAVIATDMPKVPVFYENQPIGKTGRDGKLFVPRVTAYHLSRFSIDTIDLPAGFEAQAVEAQVALREATGALITLPVELIHSATISLIDVTGRPLLPGTVITLSNGKSAIVGWDGIVLIERVTGSVTLTANGANACKAAVSVPVDAGPIANLGAVTCR
jgi:outer membrane usher protein